jgi:formylglycine-generating enzyme required for sulfatase activity
MAQRIRPEAGVRAGLLLLAGLRLAVGEPLAAAAPPALALGTPEACARYGGLPPGWGQDPHAGMVPVPAGAFTLGTRLGYEDERPELPMKVAGYWIDQTEVTVAQFASFVKATGYATTAEREGRAVVFHPPTAEEMQQRPYAWWSPVAGADWRHPEGPGSSARDNQPVTQVTLEDAAAYARWLGRRLPSEVEWEYAGKAGRQGRDLEQEPRDRHGKPVANFWQGRFPGANTAEDGHVGLAPVGCYPANGFRLYDMRGNAWEQTRDPYTGPHGPAGFARAPDPQKPDRPMVIKGGSHLCGRDFCVRYRASAREAHEANLPVSHIGFRTISSDPAHSPSALTP